MKFFIIIKLKNIICNKSKNFFCKIEAYIGRKMHYFWLNDIGKYKLLVLYFKE